MNNMNPKKPSTAMLNGVKLVLVSASVAGSIGLWSTLAEKTMQYASASAGDGENISTVEQIAAQPTLASLVQINSSAVVPSQPPPTSAPELRDVAAMPTATAYTAPEVKTVVIGVPVAGGGGGSKSKPAAKTRSS